MLSFFQGRFTVDLTGSLSFHKCLIVTIRGVNKVGMVSLVRAPVLDCAAVDPAPIVPLSVLDAVGLTVAGQRFFFLSWSFTSTGGRRGGGKEWDKE